MNKCYSWLKNIFLCISAVGFSQMKMKKLVVNSLLWFVVNQMDKLTTETIVKSIVSFYNEKEVEEAEDCLFTYFSSSERKKIRKGSNKVDLNVKDIIAVLHELGNKNIDDESVPLFVTSDFHFPNINLSNLDAVNMRNQIGSLQNKVCTLQQDKITQIKSLDDVKLSIDKLTAAMLKIQSNLPAAITPPHDERTEYMPLASSSKTASSLPVHQPISNELKLKPTVALINNDKSAPLESTVT